MSYFGLCNESFLKCIHISTHFIMDLQLALKKENLGTHLWKKKMAKTLSNRELLLSNLDRETDPFCQEHPTDVLLSMADTHRQLKLFIHTNVPKNLKLLHT